MSLDHRDAGDGGGLPCEGTPGLEEGWGWDLMQRDWSLRQREPVEPRARVLAGMRARITALLGWVWRTVRGVLGGAR